MRFLYNRPTIEASNYFGRKDCLAPLKRKEAEEEVEKEGRGRGGRYFSLPLVSIPGPTVSQGRGSGTV